MNFFDLMVLAGPILLKGTGYTLIFAFSAMFGGLLVGFVLAVLRIIPSRWTQIPATVYVSMMRGTPLLVQVFIIYYGLPSIGISFDPLTAGVLALSLNAGAYISESLRGAIVGISRGQWSAGYSLGLNYWQNLHYVVMPQALRLAVPSMSNSLISLIKDTSLVSVITVTELLLATKDVIATTFQPLPLYLAAAGIYWILSLCLEQVQARLEKHYGRSARHA
ncbi:amino acid ABC transporter, permease protein, His/Glu/Gln/Arg/opine family [Pusillimonas sp. T7-7]|uniref:amino acid ABC transporter permease n=1 Tax=Pusillimonas sp. (strain T7-7) TaxID=1007105 RepID=UPI0002084500|nr:amino acid ABC transporter permease [Pusillimonas sp. T7-7]AEC21521.1 amino acid ABC transporter, permease protein, His/Glu/Gln/Arg/opine family [Pusillimonas sp. T7-7]